jgi:uncharacterized cupredoxin-like copper-binding protein
MISTRKYLGASVGVIASLLVGGVALADSAYREFGDRGRSQDVRRTITIVMRDNAFQPQSIQVRAGETVRFRVQNRGEFVHEFNLGTAAMHVQHRREMQTMFENGQMSATSLSPAGGGHGAHGAAAAAGGHGAHGAAAGGHSGHAAMAHDAPNSILLEPGKSGELIWKFTRSMALEFACNVPGHYESGMVGRVTFQR